ncbi:hypothetical protein BC831DRAFT_455097 [Entophlyctis helioformis]|nr:hypothetical protein BC831DRAFT_455097 [Entophlyctis helioformis]
MTLNVSVKWNGRKYPVELDTAQPGLVFKMQLYSLTGVAPDRQKIMVKGGLLKDDADMSTLGMKEGQQLMMMGTVGELPKAPEQSVVFLEDMTQEQVAKALKLPAGLTNLGNTCYMNATLQCLRAIPELQTAMEKVAAPTTQDRLSNLTLSMRSLFKELASSGAAVPPLVFLQVLRSVYPQFAERNNEGYMQQDAEECWGQIIQGLNEKVPGLSTSGEALKDRHFVDQFMTTEVLATTTCDDEPNEVPSTTIETFNKLRVNIGSGVSTYLVMEIANSLVEKLEKNSPTLGRSAMYTKTSKITRLPQYLAINFVRFQWKAQEQTKAKILKRVQFPFELDMAPFCTADIQEKLIPAKLRLKEISDRKAEAKKLKNAAGGLPQPGADGDVAMASGSADAAEAVAKKDHLTVLKELNVHESLINDPGANPSGQYDLVAVLTHVGRAADSGHYIGWVKDQESNDWWKYDDDKVSKIRSEDIAKLEGGGDWHTAYICLYRSKQLE